MKNKFKQFDDLFIDLINGKMKNKHLDSFMYKVTDLGGAIFSTLIALVFIAFGSKNIKYIGIECMIVLGISQVIVQGLKKILSRERPYKIIEQLNTSYFKNLFGSSLSNWCCSRNNSWSWYFFSSSYVSIKICGWNSNVYRYKMI